MRPVWLIEAGIYGIEAEPLVAEIRRQGMAAMFISHQALQKESTLAIAGQRLADGDCVLGYGTFPFARQIQLHRRWTPGGWCDPDNLDCTTYYTHFGKFLLNQQHAILPAVEAIRQQDRLYEVFGPYDEVFARPTGCNKVFTGRCIYKDAFASALSPVMFDLAAQVVVAAPQEIDREWRLVVAENEVIAASQYAEQGNKAIAAGCPHDVRAFAESMLKEVPWQPDPIFIRDRILHRAGRFLKFLSDGISD